jgi:hypothetical protein
MHAPDGSACVSPNDGFVTLMLLLLLKGLAAVVAANPVEEHMLNCIRASWCCCCCMWLAAGTVALAVALLLPCAAVELAAAAAAAAAADALVLTATPPDALLLSLLLLLPGALQPAWHMPNRAHNAPGRCSSPGLFAVSAMIFSQPGRICCSKVGSVPIAVDRQNPYKKQQRSVYQYSKSVVHTMHQVAAAALGSLLCQQ